MNAVIYVTPGLQIKPFFIISDGTHSEVLSLNTWTFVSVTFAYYISSAGFIPKFVCETTVGTVKEFPVVNTDPFTAPDLTTGNMRLGGGGSDISFRGELANLAVYSPGAISYESTKCILSSLKFFSYM